MKIFDVGCGANKTEGAIGLDHNPRTNADVIHDLGELPYPFPDNEFEPGRIRGFVSKSMCSL